VRVSVDLQLHKKWLASKFKSANASHLTTTGAFSGATLSTL
jgi:hypothetical protein